MRAEVIALGDELTTGQRLDTNSQWLSQRLTELGIQVAFHTTIADEMADNVAAFRVAIDRVDLVVSTGGLGPTADDLTRAALAESTHTELVRDEISLAHIEQMFASRGREMPERNQVQADFPAGAVAIPNPHGTAPGIEMSVARDHDRRCTVFALPGVPAEMHEMWEATVSPKILQLQPEPRVIRHRRIKCFGVGESAMEAMLPDLIRRDREPRVGITVSDATITLRITATAADEAACFAAMEPTVQTIHESLGDLVFGAEDEELQDAVLRLLKQRKLTLAVDEWATAGLIGEWLAADNRTEPSICLTQQTFEAANMAECVAEVDNPLVPHSAEMAIQMAQRVRESARSDIGLAIAAFPPELDGPHAHVHVALAMPDQTRKLRFPCAAHPAIVRSRTAKQALNALRLALH
ncbi:MAG: CinA family nicotinamide mononucleotide deamidase-related protein [Bythopirellula sp.]